MRSTRSLVASAAALGFAGSFPAPTPVLAAVAPCERAESYAAQSGAEILKISRLSVRTADAHERPATASGNRKAPLHPDGYAVDSSDASDSSANAGNAARGGGGPGDDDATWTDFGLGEAKTALVTDARTNAAAVARILDGQTTGKAALTEPVTQLAPPNNERAVRRSTPSGRIGPMKVGAGEAGAHARWNGEADCDSTPGEASRSDTSVAGIDVLDGLVRVPERIASMSTTALERRGDDTRTVASATVTAGLIELADGHVRIRIIRPATLVTSMSMSSGGEVRYRPATIEVSGSEVRTQRLNTVGDSVEISLASRGTAESSSAKPDGLDSAIGPARPLPLPAIPGLPSVGAPDQESTPAAGSGTKLWISLGDVRQAAKGHARAARATAIKVAVTQGEAASGLPADDRTRPGYAGKQPAVALAVGFGLLETAAMSPERSQTRPEDEAPAASGVSAGLPVTGSQAGVLALAGLGLLFTGGAAVFLSKRRRDSHF
jgi:LPXTG-motif cell wall-anchored protein